MSGGRIRPLIRRVLGSIRGRFVCYFAAAMLLSLLLAFIVGGRVTEDVLGRVNLSSADAELRQMSYNIESLAENLDRQMTILLLSSSSTIIMNNDLYGELELIEAIREYRNLADSIMLNFPYIHSTYLILSDGRMVGVGRNNTRHTFFDWTPELSAPVLAMRNSATYALSLSGGLYESDFPIEQERPSSEPLISAAKKHNGHVLIFSIYESQVAGMYSGASNSGSGRIRLLDGQGSIISSGDKSEILSAYQLPDGEAQTSGLLTAASGLNRIFWRDIPSLNLTVVNEIEISEYLRDMRQIQMAIIWSLLAVLGLTSVVVVAWMTRAFAPLEALKASMRRAETGDYGGRVEPKDDGELATLIRQHNDMLINLERLTERNLRVEAEKRESEIKALRSQINPHFLFNALNTIKWMSVIAGNENAAQGLTALGGILAPIFKSDAPFTSVREELSLLDKYVEIMNLRFGGSIRLEKRVEDAALDMNMLRLAIQPLVENAIVHGFQPARRGGHIEVRVGIDGDTLRVTVTDDGVGMTGEQMRELNGTLARDLPSEGIGMMNTARRIRLSYGEAYGITIECAEAGGTRVIMTLPALDENGEKTSGVDTAS